LITRHCVRPERGPSQIHEYLPLLRHHAHSITCRDGVHPQIRSAPFDVAPPRNMGCWALGRAWRRPFERQRSPGRGATRWFQATPDPRLRVQRFVIPDFPARPHGDSPDRSLAWEHDTESTEL